MTTTRRQMQRTCCFTSAHDFQNFSWLTMMRRRLRVSQESPESQGHHAHEHVVTRGCWSNRKVPPAILNTGTPRQLALQSPMPSLVLAIDSVKCLGSRKQV
jgi:hypothetical protein